MELFSGHNVSLCIGDIETLSEMTDLGFYNPDKDEWSEFEISGRKNDLYKFVKWYNRRSWNYIVWYNGIEFDTQVIEYILRNYEDWGMLSGAEICKLIANFASNRIDDSKYGIRAPYYENQMSIRPIDVYTLFGLDNEARRSSLKKCEFQIDFPSVEEMPVHHTKQGMTDEEMDVVRAYRRNDVMATYELFKMAKGDTHHPIYKGRNLFEIRHTIKEEFGLDCLNMSDITLGDNLMKHSYAKNKRIHIKDVPRKGTFRKDIKLRHCVPSYVAFQTKKLQELLKDIKSTIIGQKDKFERKFEFYGTEYTMGLGGLHSDNKNQKWKADEGGKIYDWDVQSFYPCLMIELGIFPHHLSKEFLYTYTEFFNKRISLKPLAKTDKKVKGVIEGIKLMLNAVFGKLGSMEGWLYDKQALFSVTLAGQLTLLMLIEMLELEGIHVFSANTDGITFKTNEEEKIRIIWEKWQNMTKMKLEEAEYKWIAYQSVNDYIAEKVTTIEEDRIKKKGDFMTDFELWKNKSNRIVPLALEAYFTKDVDPEEFIKAHKNIYDFCIMSRATGENYLEEQNKKGEKIKHKKLIRYYLSSTSQWQLYKRGTGTTGKPMNVCQNASNELGDIFTQYFNQFFQRDDYQVDVQQYIYKCYKIMDGIESTKKAKALVDRNRGRNSQLNLF